MAKSTPAWPATTTLPSACARTVWAVAAVVPGKDVVTLPPAKEGSRSPAEKRTRFSSDSVSARETEAKPRRGARGRCDCVAINSQLPVALTGEVRQLVLD